VRFIFICTGTSEFFLKPTRRLQREKKKTRPTGEEKTPKINKTTQIIGGDTSYQN
jgi:hypothetical protein